MIYFATRISITTIYLPVRSVFDRFSPMPPVCIELTTLFRKFISTASIFLLFLSNSCQHSAPYVSIGSAPLSQFYFVQSSVFEPDWLDSSDVPFIDLVLARFQILHNDILFHTPFKYSSMSFVNIESTSSSQLTTIINKKYDCQVVELYFALIPKS